MSKSIRRCFLALVLVSLAACASSEGSRIVDGWRLEAPITCADLRLPAVRCQMLQQRALSYAIATGGAVSSWLMYLPVHVDVNGSPNLYTSGAGMPDALLLVRQASGEHVALMGCFQPTAAGESVTPDCP